MLNFMINIAQSRETAQGLLKWGKDKNWDSSTA
jgi:hypothetical protein